MKLYRGKYLIGIYSSLRTGEQLLGLCDNTKEFAELMGIKRQTATVILNNVFHKQTNCIRFFGQLCTVEFIPYEED